MDETSAGSRLAQAHDGTLCAALLLSAPVRAGARPNVVVILADDLGNADLGYRGSDIRTPNIDRLANEGVRLENFHGIAGRRLDLGHRRAPVPALGEEAEREPPRAPRPRAPVCLGV